MPTMVFRVDKRVDEQTQAYQYALSLHIDDGQDPSWAERPVAEDSIPTELPAPAGGNMDIAAVRDALVTEPAQGATLLAAGHYLYHLLAGTQVGIAWARAAEGFGVNPNGSERLRTFFDVRPPELSDLPWELMMRDQTRLFLDGRHVCVRGSYRPMAETSVPVPIRLLIAVGDPQDSALRAEDEIDAIWSALRDHPGEWHVEVMRGPTRDEFFPCFREVRPHIFHFIGHSALSPYGAAPSLEFRPRTGDGWELDSDLITNTLREVAPRLVFLNSCRSSDRVYDDDEREESRTAATGVAQAFEEIGAEAVLGMQADIPSDPAVRFSGELYRLLADGTPVDVAVRDARDLLFGTEPVRRAWALPLLTVRGDPDGVLAMRLALTREVVRQLIEERYHGIGSLVDRTAEHRMLWGGSDCGHLPAPAVLVTGDERVGKSALVKSCLLTWSLRGCQVAYVDLRLAGRKLGWLDLLRQVRDGLATWRPDRAAEPIRQFDHELAYRKRGLDPEPLPAVGGRTDDGGLWTPATEREPELREATFASARTMLEAVAAGGPMLLAVDHLAEGMSDDVRDEFGPRLLVPIAERAVGQVSVVVVETTGKAGELLSLQFRTRAVPVTVVPFPRSIHYLRQFGALTRRPFSGEMEIFATAIARRPGAMMPEEIEWLGLGIKPEPADVHR
ncbi:MAG TPA: CHAT domain-containing protein [Streptosporangiaceae bacterium]|nr:CHAT domain-containing protein [Streptosporangiaceae bacterium]